MFFSVITKNLNWETLTKNQSLLKDEAGLRKKNFNILGSSLKNPIFRGWRFPINQCIGGNYLKRGLGQLPNLRGILAKKWGGIFEGGGGDTLMHTMVCIRVGTLVPRGLGTLYQLCLFPVFLSLEGESATFYNQNPLYHIDIQQ